MNNFMIAFFALGSMSAIQAEYLCDTAFVKSDTVITCSTRATDGFLLSVESFRNGKRDGQLLEWHTNGHIKHKEYFRNGCPVDTSFEFYANGNIKRLTPYKDCKQHGDFVLLSEVGDTLATGTSNTGKSIGTHYAWWSRGAMKFKTNYNDSGKKHGLSEEWRADGTRKDSIVYENGQMVESRKYFENGRLQYHMWKKPGAKIFSAVHYDPKGKKAGEVKNGNGTYISFSDDGTSAQRVSLKNGEVAKMEEVNVKDQ